MCFRNKKIFKFRNVVVQKLYQYPSKVELESSCYNQTLMSVFTLSGIKTSGISEVCSRVEDLDPNTDSKKDFQFQI